MFYWTHYHWWESNYHSFFKKKYNLNSLVSFIIFLCVCSELLVLYVYMKDFFLFIQPIIQLLFQLNDICHFSILQYSQLIEYYLSSTLSFWSLLGLFITDTWSLEFSFIFFISPSLCCILGNVLRFIFKMILSLTIYSPWYPWMFQYQQLWFKMINI